MRAIAHLRIIRYNNGTNKMKEGKMPSDVKFLTVEDVEEMLQVTRSTVYNLKKRGMPFIKIGKNIRFDQNEVIDWIKSNRNSTPETSDE
jgi:excisionase family DNA binding protein